MKELNETELMDFIKNNLLKDKKTFITKSTLLFKERILDSMNILDIIGFIEDRINRKIRDEELVMSNFKNVKSIIEVFSNEQK